MDKSVFRCLPCWSEEHTQTDGLWNGVLLTMVSVRWCLWQETWTVLNTSRSGCKPMACFCQVFWRRTMVFSRRQCLDSQIYWKWRLEAKEWHCGFVCFLFCFSLAATEPRSKSDRKYVVCWKNVWEITFAASVRFDGDLQDAFITSWNSLSTVFIHWSSLCTRATHSQDDVSKF